MWDYFTRSRALCWSSELGTQQCCRDNETNLLAKIYSVLVVATPFRHETLAFFGTCSMFMSQKLYYVVTLLLSRRYKDCRVPSSADHLTRHCQPMWAWGVQNSDLSLFDNNSGPTTASASRCAEQLTLSCNFQPMRAVGADFTGLSLAED